MRHKRPVISLSVPFAIFALALVGCADAPEADSRDQDSMAEAGAADQFPVSVSSCDFTSELTEAPTKAVTLNQGATEVALALGVEDQMAGTAYLDDDVPEEWQSAYESIPVLADDYPDRETLLAVEPDFLYASYSSAFDDKVAGTREELAQDGIATYLSPFGCPEGVEKADPSFESVWDEVESVAAAFGVPTRAEELRAEQQGLLQELTEESPGEGFSIFWYDFGDKNPYAGAGEGGPQLIMDAIGATNIFADESGGWAEVSWERVLEADPDIIVLADASWSTAEDKLAEMESDSVLSNLKAVQNDAIITIPFSESTPGIRLVDGAVSVGEQLADFDPQG